MTVLMLLAIPAALLALIPAGLASGKGHDYAPWWLYGFFLFPIALVHVALIGPDKRELDRRELASGRGRRCASCREVVNLLASRCRFCGATMGLGNGDATHPVPPVSRSHQG